MNMMAWHDGMEVQIRIQHYPFIQEISLVLHGRDKKGRGFLKLIAKISFSLLSDNKWSSDQKV